VKLHSWITALGQQRTESEPGRSVNFGDSYQAVPPDEHDWIESVGCTASYRHFREGVRDYYRRNYPPIQEARAENHFNPGMGAVSRLCHEPHVGVAVLEELLAGG
jgi:hypothetical protein